MSRGARHYVGAGLFLVSTWGLYFFWLHNPLLGWLVWLGWATLIVGLVFIVAAMITLRRFGSPTQGEDFTHTTVLVETGVYGIVRHPLYLGWSLMYIAAMLLSQHWGVLISGGLGVLCMYLVVLQEDAKLLKQFGEPYRRYLQSVPALNFLAGLLRLAKRSQARSRPRNPEGGLTSGSA